MYFSHSWVMILCHHKPHQKIESLSNKAVKQYYNMMDEWMNGLRV